MCTDPRGGYGEKALDLHLSGVALWSGVPENAWSYAVGGYQVLKKGLYYRKKRLLGRVFRAEEAQEFTARVGRIPALILLGPELDTNYRRAAADPAMLRNGQGSAIVNDTAEGA